eukprot:12706-Heterococcus_DN1.PRE.3
MARSTNYYYPPRECVAIVRCVLRRQLLMPWLRQLAELQSAALGSIVHLNSVAVQCNNPIHKCSMRCNTADYLKHSTRSQIIRAALLSNRTLASWSARRTQRRDY